MTVTPLPGQVICEPKHSGALTWHEMTPFAHVWPAGNGSPMHEPVGPWGGPYDMHAPVVALYDTQVLWLTRGAPEGAAKASAGADE